MRQFEAEATQAQYWGCDIDGPSVDWIESKLSPQFRAFRVEENPGIDWPDNSFDLIWATSVFTHLTDSWAGWLSELNRVLKPGGLLMTSILGPGMWNAVGEGDWDEDRIGMCVLRPGTPWSVGGPVIVHAEWWLREHWGRGFQIVSIDPGPVPGKQGWAVLLKQKQIVTPAELERLSDDPREAAALQRNLELLQAEDRRLRPRHLRLTAYKARRVGRWWGSRIRSRITR